MTPYRTLLRSILPVILCLVAAASCNREDWASRPGRDRPAIGMDTGKIAAALRAFDALPPGTKGKPARLKAILDEAIAMGYNDQACYLAMDLGRGQADLGHPDSALLFYEQARPYCYRPVFDKSLPATFLTEFATFYHSLRADYVAANRCYYDAMSYLRANGLAEHETAISLYYFLHGTQLKLGHHDQALKYLKEGEKLALKLGHKQGLPAIREGLGDFYTQKGDLPKALFYYDLALADEPQIWDPNILINALLGKAAALVRTGRPDEALPLLEKALQTARKEKVSYSEIRATIAKGDAYNRLGRFSEAIALVARARVRPGYIRDADAGHQVLMTAYEGLGRYRDALTEQRALSAYNDSLNNVAKATALNELEVRYRSAFKDKELAAKKLLIERQRHRLAQNSILIAGISGVALLAVLIVIFLYRLAAQRQRVQQLEIHTLRRQQEIDMLRATIQGEEQERKRLSRELHDGIGSMIFSAIMRISLLKKQEPGTVQPGDYDAVLQLLEQTGGEVRKTAQNMMPDIISRQSLPEAVRTCCTALALGTSLKVDVEFYGDTCALPVDSRLVIYRVIQELVHNVVKHARATEVIVQGVQHEDHLTITIEDNGKGFDPAAEGKGMGLKNVASRIRSLYGEFQIESSTGKGTTVYMEFDCSRLMGEQPDTNSLV